MGLDMYLEAEVRVTNFGFTEPAKQQARQLADQLGLPPDDDNFGSIEVVTHAGYWRKANAIHAWFVANVQDGKDECERSYVSREQLTTLRDTCQKVLGGTDMTDGEIHVATVYTKEGVTEETQPGKVVTNPELAQELLPAQSGFFFGSTDYDEWYVKDLQHTVDVIDRCLACPDSVTFHYRSSW